MFSCIRTFTLNPSKLHHFLSKNGNTFDKDHINKFDFFQLYPLPKTYLPCQSNFQALGIHSKSLLYKSKKHYEEKVYSQLLRIYLFLLSHRNLTKCSQVLLFFLYELEFVFNWKLPYVFPSFF